MRAASSPPRCADALPAQRPPPAAACDRHRLHRLRVDRAGLFRTAFTSHPATSPVADQDRANAGPPGDDADPFEILGEVLDQCQAAGLLNHTAGPEPRLRSGRRCTASRACCWTGHYQNRGRHRIRAAASAGTYRAWTAQRRLVMITLWRCCRQTTIIRVRPWADHTAANEPRSEPGKGARANACSLGF